MVEFGKQLQKSIKGSQWEDHYLDYKRLKKLLKKPKVEIRSAPDLSLANTNNQQHHQHHHHDELKMQYHDSVEERGLVVVAADDNDNKFQQALDEEIEKVVLFLLEEQGRISKQLSQLSLQRQAIVDQVTQLIKDFQRTQEIRQLNQNDIETEGLVSTTTTKSVNNNIGPILLLLQTSYESYRQSSKAILKFVKYVEMNVTAVRKILKKHDKVYPQHKLGSTYLSLYTNNQEVDSHLNQLYHYGGLSALVITLQRAFQQLYVVEVTLLWMQQQEGTSPATSVEKDNNNENNNNKNHRRVRSLPPLLESFEMDDDDDDDDPKRINDKFDERTATATTTTLTKLIQSTYLDGGGQQQQQLALAGLLSSSSSSSSRRLPTTIITSPKEPLLQQIHIARSHLKQSTNYVHVMAAQSAMFFDDDDDDADSSPDDDLLQKPGITERTREQQISSFINLCSTFLYMTNYYIVAPTCGQYATRLGSTDSMAGIIIGMTPNAALVATVLYGWWSNYSYKSALIFASSSSILGNICYALALQQDSLTLVMIGRFLNGFGSARSINRRFIADSFNRKDRTAASAAFVTAGALGMSAGPAIAAIVAKYTTTSSSAIPTISTTTTEEEEEEEGEGDGISYYYGGDDPSSSSSLLWTVETAPGWIMLGMWSIFFACAILYFEEPDRSHLFGTTTKKEEKEEVNKMLSSSPQDDDVEVVDQQQVESDETKPLLLDKTTKIYHLSSIGSTDTTTSTNYDSTRSSASSNSSSTKTKTTRLTPIMVTLWIYFVLKLVLEALCSSCATLTNLYFGWDSQVTGMFLAILGLLIFPANMVVAKLSHQYEDRELIYTTLIIMVVSVLGIISYQPHHDYSVYRYVIFGICIFVSSNILEGPNMGLLSKTIPKSWAKGIFNSGFLATEAGTLARSVGDVMISAAATLVDDDANLLNATFLPPLAMILICLIVVYKYFDQLIDDETFDDDDENSENCNNDNK